MNGQIVIGLNTVWMVIATALVFFMEAGFAALEAGFIHSKNSMNVIMKVLMDCCVGLIGYFAFGFAIMYGIHGQGGHIQWDGFFLKGNFTFLGLSIPVEIFWLFQAAFAVAVATIVSGAVAERMKFGPYILYSFLATVIIYPVSGHWAWAPTGFLHQLGFVDFAGSTVVHAVGGWSALAAILVLGPRRGKYNADGSVNVMPAHNLPLAALGAFMLWFGWFGFNPGSTLNALDGSLAHVALTTNLAAAAGGVLATLYTMRRYGKADPSMAINGALAGLVAITAGTQVVSALGAIVIGAIAGVIVVEGVGLIDRLHADDPVGAVAVHGICGSFGTIAVGLFATNGGLLYGGGLHLLGVQALGLIVCSVWGFASTYVVFLLMKKTVGIRVNRDEEDEGLDIAEHGVPAYASNSEIPAQIADMSEYFAKQMKEANVQA
ncbi:ammonium transporter [Fodinisporobacter ferrooxydans]|uniref:Ammonium transporter n=1 Tax=Fodinisporobacter ferrooxydans TaxID=2901836 RepID=A0ABY4CHB4_9BACL|nr:ammonium transporter [Alicyclobacillaceae bacterium MYW30-H2]